METTPVIDYKAVLADLEKRRDDIDKAIAAVKSFIGLVPGAAASPTVGPMSAAQALSEIASNPDFVITSDAYFGMNIVSAAQKYLAARKRPANSMEIAEALAAGGLPTQSAKLANTVNSVITRNSQGDLPIFAKVKRGLWGLRAWYPNFRPKDAGKGDE